MAELYGIFIQKIKRNLSPFFSPNEDMGSIKCTCFPFQTTWCILNFFVSLEMSKELAQALIFSWGLVQTFLSDSLFLSLSSLQFCLPAYLLSQPPSLGLPVKAHLFQKQEAWTRRPAAYTGSVLRAQRAGSPSAASMLESPVPPVFTHTHGLVSRAVHCCFYPRLSASLQMTCLILTSSCFLPHSQITSFPDGHSAIPSSDLLYVFFF